MKNKSVYKHVVVVGVDGMGNFNSKAYTPRMDEIFKDYAVSYSALSMDPTISAQNWGGMLLGATPIVHGLTNGIVSTAEYTNKELPSVFTRLRKEMPEAYFASICNWSPINRGIIEHDVGVHFDTADNDTDIVVKIQACVKDNKPEFLFIQLDDVDGAGHSSTYGSEEYLEAVTEADGFVGEIFDAYTDAGIIDDTLFIVISDHGGIRNGHGGYTDSEKYVFLGARGKYVPKGEIGYAQTRDISAIVLTAFGLDVPEYDEKGFSAQVPYGIFPDYDKEYIRAVPTVYDPGTRPTPDYNGEKGLTAFFAPERVKLALFLDDSLKDESGNCTLRESGTVKYYSTGIYGSRGEFGKTGYAVVDGITFGENSFTIAVWLKIDRSLDELPAVCGNKDWWYRNRDTKGFLLAVRCNDTVFNVGKVDDCIEITTPFPDEISDGWIHTIVAVDREAAKLRFYYNFNYIQSIDIPSEYAGMFDGQNEFVVGNDGVRSYNDILHDLIFNMDDFFIFDGAFDDADVAKLEEYYKR